MVRDDFPPVVYVPARPLPDGRMQVELQRMADGSRGLFVFSALDRLREMYGPRGWLALTVEGLQDVHDSTPYDLLFVDRTPHLVADAAGAGERP